jgi:hypothetical protein
MNTAVYLLRFVPALGLLALYLDRVLPSDVNPSIRKTRERKEDAEQKAAMEAPQPPNESR